MRINEKTSETINRVRNDLKACNAMHAAVMETSLLAG